MLVLEELEEKILPVTDETGEDWDLVIEPEIKAFCYYCSLVVLMVKRDFLAQYKQKGAFRAVNCKL